MVLVPFDRVHIISC